MKSTVLFPHLHRGSALILFYGHSFRRVSVLVFRVVQMTGRKGRVVQTEDGQILYESRSEADVPLETLNLTEKQRFMDGEKDVAIISEAASSGISLQSDRR